MGFFEDLFDIAFGKKRIQPRKTVEMEKDKNEEKMEVKIEEKKDEMLEKEKRAKEWPTLKDQIFSKYQIQISDDAKDIATDLFGKSTDSVSVFFITDERAIRQRYIEGGDIAIEEYANNLEKHAFLGGPITSTFLRRLKALKNAKEEGEVIDTEIDIDGFTPNAKIQYSIKETDLDGQKIPARKKFSPRCEMTATMTEGFHIGPFVAYDELYFCTKEEMEQMISEDDKEGMKSKGMMSGMEIKEEKGKEERGMEAPAMEEKGDIEICPHGTDKRLYCPQCQGDIIVSPSKKKIIGICLDVTGSMKGRKIDDAQMAVARMLDRIPVNNNIDVVLIIFSTNVLENHEYIIPYGTRFTQEIKDNALQIINKLVADGGTPLYETINDFMDKTWSNGALDKEKIFFPYTYLIIVSDGEENESDLSNLIYERKRDKGAFFAKLDAYRNSGLITEIIPFAYGEDGRNIQLVRDLQNISGKILINETNPENITNTLISTVDSILYGEDNLKMMGIPVSGKKKSNKMSPSSSPSMSNM